MIQHEILTEQQKRVIASIVGKCQNCGMKCLPTPHRINRGHAGGKYTLKNIDWLCGSCHDERHANEIMGRRG